MPSLQEVISTTKDCLDTAKESAEACVLPLQNLLQSLDPNPVVFNPLDLQSFAEITAGLSLAYLGLARFRYKKQIIDCAKRYHRAPDDVPVDLRDSADYVILSAFCHDDGDGFNKNNKKFSDQAWCKDYNKTYERDSDRKWVKFTASYALLYLFAAIIYNTSGSQFFALMSPMVNIVCVVGILISFLFAAAQPVRFTIRGDAIVADATKFISRHGNSFVSSLKIHKRNMRDETEVVSVYKDD